MPGTKPPPPRLCVSDMSKKKRHVHTSNLDIFPGKSLRCYGLNRAREQTGSQQGRTLKEKHDTRDGRQGSHNERNAFKVQ